MLLLDLDHFKQVNDEHGHLMGDAVLQTVTDRIASVLRSDDCLARWGGEEFAVLAPDIDREGVLALAERAREALAEEPVRVGDVSIDLTLSVGAALAEGGNRARLPRPRGRSGALRGEGRRAELRAESRSRRDAERRQRTVILARPLPSRS